MPTKDRRQREKEDRAQTILDAAEAVMIANGLPGLSMDLVAQEAHLAKGTLYLYFASKDELLAALTLKARLLLLDAFQVAVNQHESPIDQLKAIVRTNYTFYRQYPLYQELVSLSEVNNNRPESPELQRASQQITEFTVGIAVQAQATGELDPGLDPVQLAICMWGMTVGMMQLIKVRGASLQAHLNLSETDVLDGFISLLTNGMKAR